MAGPGEGNSGIWVKSATSRFLHTLISRTARRLGWGRRKQFMRIWKHGTCTSGSGVWLMRDLSPGTAAGAGPPAGSPRTRAAAASGHAARAAAGRVSRASRGCADSEVTRACFAVIAVLRRIHFWSCSCCRNNHPDLISISAHCICCAAHCHVHHCSCGSKVHCVGCRSVHRGDAAARQMCPARQLRVDWCGAAWCRAAAGAASLDTRRRYSVLYSP